MIDNIYSRPLIPILIAMIAGIICGVGLPGYRIWAYAVLMISAGRIVWCIMRHKTDAYYPIILFFSLGYLSIQPWIDPKFPSNHIVHFADTRKWHIVGIIDSHPVKKDHRTSFILTTQSLGEHNTFTPTTGKIRVTVAGENIDIARGDRIRFDSKIRSIRSFNNPGGFNYRRYMAFKRVWGAAYTREDKMLVMDRASGGWLTKRIDAARRKISLLIEKTGEGEHRGVLKALILGERSHISPHLREAFHRAGIGHLLAISGLHIGIVASAAFFFFAWFFSRFEFFLWKAWTRKGAAIFSFIPALLYAVLAGMSPSTQRALIMVGMFLLTFLLEREQDLITTLAAAAMVIIMLYPPAIYTISFQLSFVAVFSIVYGTSRIALPEISNRHRLRGVLFRKVAAFFMVSVVATLGTLPLVMFYFNRVSLVGIIANYILVPIIGFAVVPVGLLAVFILPITETVSIGCMQIAADILQVALKVVALFSDLPYAALYTITPSIFEILCYYMLVWAMLNLIAPGPGAVRNTETDHAAQTEPELTRHRNAGFKRTRLARSVLALVLLAIAIDVGYWSYQRFWRNNLRVTIIDVGHGTAGLLELPGGHCILVDGGGFADNAVFDVGARVIAPFLWRKKIRTVETLVLSHPNSDHLNGLIFIAEHFRVKDIWTNGEKRQTLGYQRLAETIARRKIRHLQYRDLPKRQEINGVDFQILYPPEDFLERGKKERWRSVNNNSLVVKATYGKVSFLFTGDIMSGAEKDLTAMAGVELKSTVLMVPHHGSRSSSSSGFIDAVQPRIGIISSGWRNRFNLPNVSVLESYRQRGVRILRTDSTGAVTCVSDGNHLNVSGRLKDSSNDLTDF
jgi:competence protein ComEC